MAADQGLVKGREITVYYALFKAGEGLVPSTPLRFDCKLIMTGCNFEETASMGEAGKVMFVRSATVNARSLEYGRSRVPNATYTDTAQRERARLDGLASDSGCSFVAGNSRRTFVVGG